MIVEKWSEFLEYRDSRIKACDKDKETKRLNDEWLEWSFKIPEFFTTVKRRFLWWEWEEKVMRDLFDIQYEELDIKMRVGLIESKQLAHKLSFNIPEKTVEAALDWMAEEK